MYTISEALLDIGMHPAFNHGLGRRQYRRRSATRRRRLR